ncbi:MAG: hypothetical protein FWG10_10085 [Eubacteriaceae bacterium]|nr:hypothetical protein [Eubacteriaceae bacterium]
MQKDIPFVSSSEPVLLGLQLPLATANLLRGSNEKALLKPGKKVHADRKVPPQSNSPTGNIKRTK